MNNPALYNAAVTAASGISQPAILTDPIAADYLSYSNLIAAIATAIDAAIPAITGGPSQAQCDLLKGIVTGVFLGRYPVNAASYVTVANGIAALFTEMNLKIDTSGAAVPNTATQTIAAPVETVAGGVQAWVNLLTIDCSTLLAAVANTFKLEVGIDATDHNETTNALTELRANRSYNIAADGTPTLLNDSTVFASANIQFVIVGKTIVLQGNKEAAAGANHKYSGSLYYTTITTL